MVGRATRILLAGGVLFLAVLALAASTAGTVDPGLGFGFGFGRADGEITRVDTGLPAWRMGIEAGDRVIELHASDEPGGWRVVTTDGQVERQLWQTTDIDPPLRAYLPWSVLTLGIAVLAALPGFRASPVAAPALAAAYALAAQPLIYAGYLALLVGGVAAFLAGALVVAAFAPWRRWFPLLIAFGLALGVAWVVTILAVPDAFESLDRVRLPVAAGYAVVGLFAIVAPRRIWKAIQPPWNVSFVDLVYSAVVIAFLVAAWLLWTVPFELLAVAAIVAIGVYPSWRGNAISAFERFVTSRARRDAAILAIEEERGRLARDIHDAPLQDLSGVIRRLENVPGAEQEANALREVAARLRDVATALRPPVLEDLGLVSAILDLRDQLATAHPGWTINVEVDDMTSGRRPPPDVELAALRVMQEAAGNAVAHSGGRRLTIRGSVAEAAIDLTASDDGSGFREDEARSARRAGHFGLDSMRERAEAVDAETIVASDPEGSTVTFRWAAGK